MTTPVPPRQPAPNILARLLLGVFTLFGLCAGGLMMYAAWDHNPQGEFHDETGVHWLLWLSVGLSWFVTIAGIPWLIAAVVRIRAWSIKRRAEQDRQ